MGNYNLRDEPAALQHIAMMIDSSPQIFTATTGQHSELKFLFDKFDGNATRPAISQKPSRETDEVNHPFFQRMPLDDAICIRSKLVESTNVSHQKTEFLFISTIPLSHRLQFTLIGGTHNHLCDYMAWLFRINASDEQDFRNEYFLMTGYELPNYIDQNGEEESGLSSEEEFNVTETQEDPMDPDLMAHLVAVASIESSSDEDSDQKGKEKEEDTSVVNLLDDTSEEEEEDSQDSSYGSEEDESESSPELQVKRRVYRRAGANENNMNIQPSNLCSTRYSRKAEVEKKKKAAALLKEVESVRGYKY